MKTILTDEFQPGDIGIVYKNDAGHSFPAGELVRVTRGGLATDRAACYLDGSDYWFVCLPCSDGPDIRHLTKAEYLKAMDKELERHLKSKI